jgi:hypothetical protein
MRAFRIVNPTPLETVCGVFRVALQQPVRVRLCLFKPLHGADMPHYANVPLCLLEQVRADRAVSSVGHRFSFGVKLFQQLIRWLSSLPCVLLLNKKILLFEWLSEVVVACVML